MAGKNSQTEARICGDWLPLIPLPPTPRPPDAASPAGTKTPRLCVGVNKPPWPDPAPNQTATRAAGFSRAGTSPLRNIGFAFPFRSSDHHRHCPEPTNIFADHRSLNVTARTELKLQGNVRHGRSTNHRRDQTGVIAAGGQRSPGFRKARTSSSRPGNRRSRPSPFSAFRSTNSHQRRLIRSPVLRSIIPRAPRWKTHRSGCTFRWRLRKAGWNRLAPFVRGRLPFTRCPRNCPLVKSAELHLPQAAPASRSNPG